MRTFHLSGMAAISLWTKGSGYSRLHCNIIITITSIHVHVCIKNICRLYMYVQLHIKETMIFYCRHPSFYVENTLIFLGIFPHAAHASEP